MAGSESAGFTDGGLDGREHPCALGGLMKSLNAMDTLVAAVVGNAEDEKAEGLHEDAEGLIALLSAQYSAPVHFG